MVYVLKREYVFKINIFDGEKWSRKFFLKFLNAQSLFGPTDLLNKRDDFCSKLKIQ